MPTHDFSSAASSSLNHQPICTEPENNFSNDDAASWSNSDGSITTAMENEDFSPLFGQNVESHVVVAVIRAITLCDNMSGSQKDFLSILEYGRDLYYKGDNNLLSKWPTSMAACIQILKKAGYKEPHTYYVCLDASHPCLWSTLENVHQLCKYCSKPGTIQFHYLPLSDKVKRWCSSASFCFKMTAHWEEKDHWIAGSGNSNKCEIWDGERFAELSWFWDPAKKWLLPARCSSCKLIVSADVIAESQTSMQQVIVTCPHCHTSFEHLPQYAYGDPRNLALIGHWDGWQPFSTSIKHSCGMYSIILLKIIYLISIGSIEISIATMKKADRLKTEEVYVCGFIPNYQLPNKAPWYLDPFLHPLISDIEDAFINGILHTWHINNKI